jgi:phenylalanyl-tRNA synthetase alpha subunit
MNKQDIDKASATLTQAINFFSPMVVALNGADEVFSILANATAHKASLTREVEALKKSADDLKAQVEASALAITANDAAAEEAKAAALQAIADAQQQAQTQVAEILASVATDTKAAKVAFAALQADIAAKIEANQKRHDSNVVQAQIREAELDASITQLEAKLEKAKAQAKKFADSFTVE